MGKMLSDKVKRKISDFLRKELKGCDYNLTIGNGDGICDTSNSPVILRMSLLMTSLHATLEEILDEKPATNELEQYYIKHAAQYKDELIALKNQLNITVQAGINSASNDVTDEEMLDFVNKQNKKHN